MGTNTGVRGRQRSIPHLARRALSVLTRRAALALCLLSLASCSDFSSASRSWWLRYHPEEDQAVYVEVMDGVTAEASSAEPLRKLVAGWRRFPAEGGLFTFDLDEELDWSDLPEAEAAERVRAILASLRAQVKVSEAGLFRGADAVEGLHRVAPRHVAQHLHLDARLELAERGTPRQHQTKPRAASSPGQPRPTGMLWRVGCSGRVLRIAPHPNRILTLTLALTLNLTLTLTAPGGWSARSTIASEARPHQLPSAWT